MSTLRNLDFFFRIGEEKIIIQQRQQQRGKINKSNTNPMYIDDV